MIGHLKIATQKVSRAATHFLGVETVRTYAKFAKRYNITIIYQNTPVSFFRQYIAPIIIFAIFLFTLVLVSSRAFLPDDMVAPAPIGAMLSHSFIS